MQCATMASRRKLTMNWEGLGDNDDDRFFESRDRISSALSLDLASSAGSDVDDFEDSRLSFTSTISSASSVESNSVDAKANSASMLASYDMWMAEPGDIKERRKRLLQGMGLASSKDMLRMASTKIARTISRNREKDRVSAANVDHPHPSPPRAVDSAPKVVKVDSCPEKVTRNDEPSPSPSHAHPTGIVFGRSRSDSDIDAFSERQVVDWIDSREMVTAASYTPDGQGAVIGSHEGMCRFYSIDDYKLEHTMDIQMKTKSQSKKLKGFHPQAQAKKITGFQYVPWNPSEVLITSTDSRLRIYNGEDLIQKFRGFRNTSSQSAASFTPDGRHIISASEDSQVYIWKAAESKSPGGGKKNKITVQAYEHFPSKDVTIAIAWPGSSTANEPPFVEINSKRHAKLSTSSLPNFNSNSPTHEDNMVGGSNRKKLPPLPKKTASSEVIPNIEDDDVAHSPPIDPGIGVNNTSHSFSAQDSPPVTASVAPQSHSFTSRSYTHNGGHGGQTVQATAWGMAIVTASFEGEIRVYQNFGLPRKV